MQNPRMKRYWRGYRHLKELHENGWNLEEAFKDIDQGNASNSFAAGARRYYERVRNRRR